MTDHRQELRDRLALGKARELLNLNTNFKQAHAKARQLLDQ